MTKLNIFVDETGDFGFSKGSSVLYGISFTFHNQNNDISFELNKLNSKLKRIGYTNMIHMADLVMKRGDYKTFSIKMRKEIFNYIYQFSRRIVVNYYTIIIDKNYVTNSKILRNKLIYEINKMIKNNEKYFNKFDKLVIYYDNGQEMLGNILESSFSKFYGYEHITNFNHKEERLFQVSDMLTYIDKYDYKYKHKLPFTKSDKFFFSYEEIRKILKELKSKRL